MPKKLWGSPASGRIIVLERNGLTVKEGGIIKKGDFFPYAKISSVSHDCPLVGFGTITLYIGYRKVEAYGFTRGQAKQVQDAVNAGFYDDSDAEDNSDNSYDQMNNEYKEENTSVVQTTEPNIKPKSYEQKQAEEEARLQSATDDVLKMQVDPTDEDGLVKNMTALISVLETNDGDSGPGSEELDKLRKASMSKFSTQLSLLRVAFPDNKLLPYFTSKEQAFIEAEKKRKRKFYIILACCFAPLLIGTILALIFG